MVNDYNEKQNGIMLVDRQKVQGTKIKLILRIIQLNYYSYLTLSIHVSEKCHVISNTAWSSVGV